MVISTTISFRSPGAAVTQRTDDQSKGYLLPTSDISARVLEEVDCGGGWDRVLADRLEQLKQGCERVLP